MTTTTGATSLTGTAVNYASLQMGTGTTTDKTSLGTQDFMNLLVTQLENQDPSSPTDSAQIMQQTATLAQMQSMNTLTTTMQDQYAMQQKLTASSFVGQSVTYTDASGNAETGTVKGASFSSTGTTLTIGGTNVDLDDVTGITDGSPSPAPAAAAAATTSGTTSGTSDDGSDAASGTSTPGTTGSSTTGA